MSVPRDEGKPEKLSLKFLRLFQRGGGGGSVTTVSSETSHETPSYDRDIKKHKPHSNQRMQEGGSSTSVTASVTGATAGTDGTGGTGATGSTGETEETSGTGGGTGTTGGTGGGTSATGGTGGTTGTGGGTSATGGTSGTGGGTSATGGTSGTGGGTSATGGTSGTGGGTNATGGTSGTGGGTSATGGTSGTGEGTGATEGSKKKEVDSKKKEMLISSAGGSESHLKLKEAIDSCLERKDHKDDDEKIAVVTGGNRGIGFAIVKQLCSHPRFRGRIYLTTRTKEEGESALRKLQMRRKNCTTCKVCYVVLDVTECPSIKRLAAFLKEKHGHLDILVNNAAIAYPRNFPECKAGDIAECTIRTNYFGVVNLSDALFPLLRPHARVVNISSSEGYLHRVCATELRKKFADPCLAEEELHQLMLKYIDDSKMSRELEEGWPDTAYSVSKVAVSALTRIQQREFLREGSKEDVIVNHVHPGYVETEMTCFKGHLTPDEGAKATVYAAMLHPCVEGPKGAFIWHDLSLVNWVDGPLPCPGY